MSTGVCQYLQRMVCQRRPESVHVLGIITLNAIFVKVMSFTDLMKSLQTSIAEKTWYFSAASAREFRSLKSNPSKLG